MTIPVVSDQEPQGKVTRALDGLPTSEAIEFAQNVNDMSAPSGLDEKVAAAHVQASEPARPQYEYSRPMSVGGIPATAPYTLPTPFSSPCEICITSVAFAGQTLFVLITDADGVAVPSDTSTLGTNAWSLVVTSNVLTTIPLVENWYPLAQQTYLHVYVGGNGSGTKSAWVNVQYRRKLNPAGVPWLGG